MEIQPGMGSVSPNWLAYFMVDDIEVSHAKALELGGKSMVLPTEILGGARFCAIQDPQGAVCGLFQAGPDKRG